jgi:hypothetical protein
MRQLMVVALAGALVLVGAGEAMAKKGRVNIPGAHGLYTHNAFTDPDTRSVRHNVSLKACDDRKDGAGVVVSAFLDPTDPKTLDVLIGVAESRGGVGTCGKRKSFSTGRPGDLYVEVCRHDLSEEGPLEDCETRNL